MVIVTSQMVAETTTAVRPRRWSFRKIGLRLIKLILYLAFVGAAVYYTPKILAKQLHTAYPLATITSGSMWPVLQTNDLVLMKGSAGSEVAVGQIIIYKNPAGFTIHRLIRKENGKLITKGDANNVEDAPVTEEEVIGRVVYVGNYVFRIPWLGAIARGLGPQVINLEKKI